MTKLLDKFVIEQKAGLGSKDVEQNVTVNVLEAKEYSNLSCVPDLDIVFDSQSLRVVVERCYKEFTKTSQVANGPIDKTKIDLEKKHELNKLCPDFWEDCIALEYEYQFDEFEHFLEIRENEDLLSMLEFIAKSINQDILSKRSQFSEKGFQVVIQNLGNTLVEAQYEALQGKQSTISLVLYYLYSRCLLGRKTLKEKQNVIAK
ncbi:ABC-three component system protein [Vibrio splendidus]